jgi:hypothetical protein
VNNFSFSQVKDEIDYEKSRIVDFEKVKKCSVELEYELLEVTKDYLYSGKEFKIKNTEFRKTECLPIIMNILDKYNTTDDKSVIPIPKKYIRLQAWNKENKFDEIAFLRNTIKENFIENICKELEKGLDSITCIKRTFHEFMGIYTINQYYTNNKQLRLKIKVLREMHRTFKNIVLIGNSKYIEIRMLFNEKDENLNLVLNNKLQKIYRKKYHNQET